MRRGKFVFRKIYLFYIVNVIAFVAGIIAMYRLGSSAENFFQPGVLYISPIVSSDANAFSADDFNGSVSYETVADAVIAANGIQAFSPIAYTNAAYAQMNLLNMRAGSFFPDGNEDAVVISSALAWKLFGSFDVVGENLTVWSETYNIVGVVGESEVGAANYFAWLPDAADAKISGIYYKSGDYDVITGYREAQQLLTDRGKSLQNYRIADLNLYVKNFLERPKLILSLTGAVIIIFIAIQLFYFVRHWVRDARRGRKKIILQNSIIILLSCAIIVFLFSRLDFSFWIPGFNGGGFGQFFQTLTNSGLLPSKDYLSYNLAALSGLNDESNIMLAMCVITLVNLVMTVRIPKIIEMGSVYEDQQ